MARTALLAMLAACSGAGPAATGDRAAATAAVVAPAHVSDRVLLTGTLHPLAAAELVVPTTDQRQLAVRWLIPSGSVVNTGDRVAELDSAPLGAPLQERRTSLAAGELQLRVLRRADEVALAGKRNAVRRAQIDRDKAALHAKLPAELVDAHTAHDNDARLAHAEIALRSAERELASAVDQTAVRHQLAELDLERQRRTIAEAERQIASLVLRAPRDGVAVVSTLPWSDHPVRVGDIVPSTAVVATIPDLTAKVEVSAQLSDVDDGRVAPGMTGTCTLDAYPNDAMPCTVETVAPVARPSVGKSPLRRSFEVTLAVDPSSAPPKGGAASPGKAGAYRPTQVSRLRAGMSFEVVLPVAKRGAS